MPGILPREYKNRINGCPATTVENFNFFREWDQSVPRPSLGKLWIIELKEIKDTYCYDYEIKVSSDWYTIDVIYSPLVGRHSRRWSWTSREWLLWLTLYTEVTWRDKGVPFHSCIYDPPLGEREHVAVQASGLHKRFQNRSSPVVYDWYFRNQKEDKALTS